MKIVDRNYMRFQKVLYKQTNIVTTSYELFILRKVKNSFSLSLMSMDYNGDKVNIFDKFFNHEKGELDIYSFTLFKKTFEISIHKKESK